MNHTLKCNCFLLFIILALSNKCFSQQTNYIGLDFTIEKASGSFRPGPGLVFESQITRHSGIETGAYYRTYMQDFYVTVSDSTDTRIFYGQVAERHVSVPLQYKFYSRIINLAAGPTFDFYLGWKQKHKSTSLEVNAYNVDPVFFIGFIAKASKSIRLSENFILEPEIRFNPIITSERNYLGFAVAGKYKL